MSYKKIAKILNIDPKTVKKAILSARTPSLSLRRSEATTKQSQKKVKAMSWPYSIIYRFLYSTERYTWTQIRILKETDKAILVECGVKIWIPKSRIYRIRLRSNIFEIYVKESVAG